MPPLSPSPLPIEQELQRRLFGEGLAMRTFDCTEGERLLPCGTTNNGRGGLTDACLKERTLSSLERCFAGEIRLSRGLNHGLSHWLPASFLRHDLPLSAYEGTGISCTTGMHIGCAASGVHVGLVLPVPGTAGRGPAFPHDAWTEFESGWDVRPRCAGQLSANEYARQRLEYSWGTQPCDGSLQSLFRFSGAFARNASVTCWDEQWETAVARQRAYWSHSELDAKAMSCGHPCGVHNQVGIAAGHWRRALAIFYRAREGAGIDTRSTRSSALRVALLARDVFARLGVMAAAGPLPIVEFRPASLGDLSNLSLVSPTWRQQAVWRAFRGISPGAASAAAREIDRAAAAVDIFVNATPCRTAACARERRTSSTRYYPLQSPPTAADTTVATTATAAVEPLRSVAPPQSPLLAWPRISLLLPGFGGDPERARVIKRNLRRLGGMPIILSCTIFVYRSMHDLSTKRLRQLLLPEANNCTFPRQPGFWTHHVRAHTVEARTDFILLLMDSVELNNNVEVAQLAATARAACLNVASPACPSCNTKVLIQPDHSYVTKRTCGRLVEFVDAQLALISVSAFACWQQLIDTIGLETDPYGWRSWGALPSYCAHIIGAPFRTGIIDTMTVEKRVSSKDKGSKATYSWANATRSAAAAQSKLAAVAPWVREPDVTHIIGPLSRPPAVVHEQHAVECASPSP